MYHRAKFLLQSTVYCYRRPQQSQVKYIKRNAQFLAILFHGVERMEAGRSWTPHYIFAR